MWANRTACGTALGEKGERVDVGGGDWWRSMCCLWGNPQNKLSPHLATSPPGAGGLMGASTSSDSAPLSSARSPLPALFCPALLALPHYILTSVPRSRSLSALLPSAVMPTPTLSAALQHPQHTLYLCLCIFMPPLQEVQEALRESTQMGGTFRRQVGGVYSLEF